MTDRRLGRAAARRPSPTLAARGAAIALLEGVLGRHRTLEDALDALPPLEARDRGFAHLLAATVLRRLGTLDAVIEPYLRRPPPEAVRHALRIGAAQLLLLGTPPHAAVGATVAAVRALPKGAAFTGLANAVLRRIAAEGAAALDGLGQVAYQRGDDARAVTLAEESLALHRELGYRRGIAASLARKHNASPRDIYEKHLEELKAALTRGAGKTD